MAKKYTPISQQRDKVREELDITGYVDLNSPKIRKLFKNDISTLEEAFNMKWYSHREWVALPEAARERYTDTLNAVLSGERLKTMYETAETNYTKGIENALGDEELADKFQYIASSLAGNNAKLKKFYKDMPDLYMFYKRSKKDGGYTNASLSDEGMEAYRDEIEEVVNKWLDKEGLEY